jgi:hypothetical protein
MEPAFYRGDLLFLTNYSTEPLRVGEVCVFKIRERDIPIVHRIHAIHEELVVYCCSSWWFQLLTANKLQPTDRQDQVPH